MDNCCPSPVINQGVCDICFTKVETDYGFQKIDPNCDGLIYARYGGYYHLHHPFKDVLLLSTTGVEGPVDGVGYRFGTAACALIIMAIAYFVARFVS